MIIQTNMQSMQAGRQLKSITNNKQKTIEKLSSGLKINRAADDAAGLCISEKMRAQIRGLDQSIENLQDGISLVQLADGALNETHAILQRMNELSVQAANGTNTEKDREAIDVEMQHLISEVDRIAYTTNYNKEIFPLLGGSRENHYSAGAGTVNKLGNHRVLTGPFPFPYREGEGGLAFEAVTDSGVTGVGSIGGGSSGAMIKVTDAGGREVKVMLNRDTNFPGSNLTVTVNPDKTVNYDYNDGTISFSVVQSVSTFDEVDADNLKGNSFFDVQYTFQNTSAVSLNYDLAVAVDNFAGNFDRIPYYLNGVPKTGQMKENIPAGGDQYQIVTPPVASGGLTCEVITRLSGNGIMDPADKFMMIGDMNNPGDIGVIWNDLYSPNQTSTGSGGGLRYADEVCGMWLNRSAPPGGSYTTNLLQGITYNVKASTVNTTGRSGELWIQAGANSGQGFYVPLVNATAKNLKIENANVLTAQDAKNAITTVGNAIKTVNSFRGTFGAYQNRMEHAVSINGNSMENTQAAESVIRDADMAEEMVDFSKVNILSQAAESMLAQANKMPEMVLKLLQ